MQTLFFKIKAIITLLYMEKNQVSEIRRSRLFFPSTYPAIIFLNNSRFCFVLYGKSSSVWNQEVSSFSPSTYPAIIFQNSSCFCLILYRKNSSVWKREGKSVFISLPPMQTLKIFFNAVICHKIYSLNEVWIISP